MSYKDYLNIRIKALEEKIKNTQGEKTALEMELYDLMRKEFEEELREEADTKTLLKG